MNTLFLGFDKLPPYTDGQIVELSYQNNVLKLTLKNYKEEIATYSFLNIFQLFSLLLVIRQSPSFS